MAEYKDLKAGDMFVTDYGAKAVVLDMDIPETGKTETWFTSFNLETNHYDYPMEGKLLYRTASEPCSNGSGELTLVNEDIWTRHLSRHYVSREQDAGLSKTLLEEAKQNVHAKDVSISVGLYNRIELDKVSESIEKLL